MPSNGQPSLAYRQAMGEGQAPPKATPADAFHAARAHLRRGERLDMVSLAGELGVARATLYRWTGDRDQLLADVIWAELDELIAAADARAKGRGRKRLEQTIDWFNVTVARSAALRAVRENEHEVGRRFISAPNGPIHPRLVARLAALIEREADAGRYRPPAAPALLAEAIVAVAERYLHQGGDPGLESDPESARRVVALLLREQCPEHPAAGC
jgi:AcrR family transcriptional regulator